MINLCCKKQTCAVVTSLALMVLGPILSTFVNAGEVKSLAEVLPAKTPLYLRINEPARLFLDELRSPVVLNALRNIPDIGPQLDNPQIDQIKAVLGALGSTEDLSWSQMVREVLSGPAEIAMASSSNKLVLSVVPKDVARLGRIHAKLIEFVRQDATGKGNPDPVTVFQHEGVECYSLTPTEAHAIVGERFMLASTQQLLKDAIDHLTGKKKADSLLGQEPEFMAAVGAAKPESHDAFGFVRYDLLRESGSGMFEPLDEYNPLMALLFGGWVEAYNQADWLGLVLDVKNSKPVLEAILPVDEETAKGEIRSVFTPPAGQAAPAALKVPNQVGSLTLWRDLGKVWNVRESVVRGPALQGLNGLDNGIGQFFGGRDFGTGVLGALKSDWQLIVAEQDVNLLIPKPDLLLPAFAITVGFDEKDDDFRQRWIIAFQSLVGVLNVVGAQQKAPTLVQNQEQFEEAAIYTARFLPPAAAAKNNGAKVDDQGVHIRHNFRPTLAFLGDHIIIATTAELARDVVKAMNQPAANQGDADTHSMNLNVNGSRLAGILDVNRERLVMQNMVEKGHGRKAAETEIGGLEALIRGLNQATVSTDDTQSMFRIRVGFDLNPTN